MTNKDIPPAGSALHRAWAQADAVADANAVQQLVQARAAAPEPELSGNGFTYRHDWGLRRGKWVLRLNWAAVTPQSRVLVAVGEGAGGGPDSGKVIGSGRFTVHNVAPRAGGVDIWVDIEWSADLSLYADYLVVNP